MPQQRKMATTMQEVFGDMLLIQPVDKNETCLPSPYALRRKILLKHHQEVSCVFTKFFYVMRMVKVDKFHSCQQVGLTTYLQILLA